MKKWEAEDEKSFAVFILGVLDVGNEPNGIWYRQKQHVTHSS